MIRDLNEDPFPGKKNVADVLSAVIDDEGGPLIRGGPSAQEQRSFDTTSRKLHRFLTQPPR